MSNHYAIQLKLISLNVKCNRKMKDKQTINPTSLEIFLAEEGKR